MNTTKVLGVALMATILGSACASNSRSLPLSSNANLRTETHAMWTRPTEVGYLMGPEISGTATVRQVLGFHVGESKPGASVFAILGPLLGGGQDITDPVMMHAAFNAAEAAGAEGIYLTRVASESSGFFIFFSNTTTTVHGRALKLKDLGPVSQDRADQWRFAGTGPELVIIRDGKADVNIRGIDVE